MQLKNAIEKIKALNATEKGSLNVRKTNTFFFLIHLFFVYSFCSFYFCHIKDATTRMIKEEEKKKRKSREVEKKLNYISLVT